MLISEICGGENLTLILVYISAEKNIIAFIKRVLPQIRRIKMISKLHNELICSNQCNLWRRKFVIISNATF